jgi:hypothetical protein
LPCLVCAIWFFQRCILAWRIEHTTEAVYIPNKLDGDNNQPCGIKGWVPAGTYISDPDVSITQLHSCSTSVILCLLTINKLL